MLCAGAFTGRLSKLLGEPIPLETERGYHTQIMAPGISMRHSIIWPARAFMVTPTAGGIRVGGTVEMAGLDAPPDYRRARILVKRAKEALPDLRADETTEWMGHRPALPDTVPIIGPSAKTPRRLLRHRPRPSRPHLCGDDRPPDRRSHHRRRRRPIDLKPYRVDRF